MRNFIKTSFIAGLNQQVDPSKVNVEAGEYYLLSNARVRRNAVRPIRVPRDITSGLPFPGLLQGAYAINAYQVVFVAGRAYWKNFDPESPTWNLISGFQMSATADRIWLELVPASSVNFARTSTDADDKRATIEYGLAINGSPQCAIVMDGESQPWVIFPNGTARVTQAYDAWSVATPEYVPAACKFPMFHDGKLYCVGKDERGVFNQLFHSVSGRPLDFMVPISSTGGKISASEAVGGAPAVAYHADFGETTCLRLIPSVDAAFLLTTVNNSHLIVPDYNDLVFGEPTFSRQFLFNVGALNQECVVDMLGNTALIHYAGIRDFNSIVTLRNEGRNSPISQRINDLVADITQTYGAAINYDNYAVFALKTRYGPAVVWYDTMLQQFVAVDIFAEVIGDIKQFSSILTRTTRRLLFITSSNRLYEYDPPTGVTGTVRLHLADFVPSMPKAEHRVRAVRLNFGPVRTAGNVQVTVYRDGQLDQVAGTQLAADQTVDAEYDSVPYTTTTQPTGHEISVEFDSTANCTRAGVMIEFDADADLLSAGVELDEADVRTTQKHRAAPHATITPQTLIFVGNDGDTDDARTALNYAIQRARPDYVFGVGNLAYSSGTAAELAAKYAAYWQNLRNLGKYFAVPGSSELVTDLGEPFFQALRQAPTRYFTLALTSYLRVHLFNSGYNASGTQVEADNLNEATIAESTQGVWLSNAIAAGVHNIVLMAHPAYSSVTAKERMLLQALPTGSLTINADAGVYERIIVNGKAYFTVGTGSANHLDAAPATQRAGSYAIRTGTVGYLRLRVWPLSIEVDFVDASGNTLDQFIVRK